jgi:hypothetical protein
MGKKYTTLSARSHLQKSKQIFTYAYMNGTKQET